MRRWITGGLMLSGLASLVCANEFKLKPGDDEQQCQGMYSKNTWGGNKDPAITVKFLPSENKDDVVSLVIFEFSDEEFLGRYTSEDSFSKVYICDQAAVTAELCNSTSLGEFILAPSTNASSTGSIVTEPVNLSSAQPIYYPIKRTGYYCVWAHAFSREDLDFEAVVVFQNAYGELPAAQIAKLPFYGGLTIVYALIGALWAFLYVQHRRDILPVQNYITAIIIFLIIEMLITWAFYDYQNVHGTNVLSQVLMIIVAILNAGRNSFSFFLLLIVCMGYGVVKPSLGSLMKWVRLLAVAHFVFGVVYAIASLTVTPDSAGPLVLLVILPLAATLTAFYIWTLNSLKLTMRELEERKQNVKLLMFKRLWWVLLGSIVVIFGFFFLNSLTFAGHGSPDFVPTHWKTRWFVLDGWLNLVYLVDMAVIAFLWRPTANNRRFAMSEELAQDDDGFEIASIAGSEDEERGLAGNGRREREEGEAIFEVGGGEGWSDDEEGKEEGKRLTGGRKND
ncbi:Membrane protein ptm1 [Rhizina undulata]